MDRLKVAWLSSPYERFGQFFYNALADHDDMERIYYMTDDELITEVEAYIKRIEEITKNTETK